MEKRLLFVFVLSLFLSSHLSAQSPEQVVSDYVRLLNDWLASPYDTQKKNKVLELLANGRNKATMKDEIVELFNDVGDVMTDANNYLTLFSTHYKNSGKLTSVELVCAKDMSNNALTKINAVLKYSGGINLTTAAAFWIFDKKIGHIVMGDEERFWLRNNPCTNPQPLPVVVDNTNRDIVHEGKKSFQVHGESFNMIYVEGGTFLMGAQSEDSNDSNYDMFAFYNHKPVQQVTVQGYYIGELEVTIGLWNAVMDRNKHFTRFNNYKVYPARYCSWNDCQDFIRRLNQITGQNFRLPTEAEWEFAARGGNKSRGFIYSGSNDKEKVAWCNYGTEMHSRAPYYSFPVGTKSPNELGIYDMSGNVSEWCQDLFDETISKSNYVVRGGNWFGDESHARVRIRASHDIAYTASWVGFRLALSTQSQ